MTFIPRNTINAQSINESSSYKCFGLGFSSFESSGGLSTLAVIIIRNSAITRIPVNIMKK